MARFDTVGLDEVMRRLGNVASAAAEDTIREMLSAGAEVVIEEQRRSIKSCGLIDTGDMYNSVKDTGVKKQGEETYTEVYPQGKDRKGVRNAEKAFIAEYGSSRQVGTRWFTAATEKSDEPAHAAMRKVLEDKQNGR